MIIACTTCGSDFAASEAARRKRTYTCKPCRAKRTRADYERRKAVGLRVSGYAMPLEYHRTYQKTYVERPGVRQRHAEQAKLRMLNPIEAAKAGTRRLTRNAVRSGALTRQSCEVCGNPKVDAHHDDYSRPLDVRWLCRLHHRNHHAELARGIASEVSSVGGLK